jgi:hypothetical protein
MYLVVASVAIFVGKSIIRDQLHEMDQDETVAYYLDLKVRSTIKDSQELKEKLARPRR